MLPTEDALYSVRVYQIPEILDTIFSVSVFDKVHFEVRRLDSYSQSIYKTVILLCVESGAVPDTSIWRGAAKDDRRNGTGWVNWWSIGYWTGNSGSSRWMDCKAEQNTMQGENCPLPATVILAKCNWYVRCTSFTQLRRRDVDILRHHPESVCSKNYPPKIGFSADYKAPMPQLPAIWCLRVQGVVDLETFNIPLRLSCRPATVSERKCLEATVIVHKLFSFCKCM